MGDPPDFPVASHPPAGGQGYGYGGGRMGGDLGEWRGVSEGMFSSKIFLHSTRHIEMSN